MTRSRTARLFLGGELGAPPDREMREPALDIAVDSGYRHAAACGVTVDILVGDLDSLDESEVVQAERSDCRIVRSHPAKDWTDFELALRVAVEEGADSIHVFAMLGGRPDHALGNLCALAHPDFAHCRREFWFSTKGRGTVLSHETSEIMGRTGDVVSLIPLGGPAIVTTTGMLYDIERVELSPFRALGLSNELKHPNASVNCEAGVVVVVQPGEEGHLQRLGLIPE